MRDGLRIAEVDASRKGIDTLERFYRDLYVRNFPDAHERESLANMRRYLRLKASGWYGANNYHVLILYRNGVPVGGSVSDYLAVPNAGIIEFLFTDVGARAMGLGKTLLRATLRRLRQDARSVSSRPLRAVLAEMNDPYRKTGVPDNMDPFERAAIWGGWGFAKLDFPYIQPALSVRQRPVHCLALVMKSLRPRRPAGVSAEWLLSAIREYMRWAMRISDPALNAQYRDMARAASTRRRVAVIPLCRYVGREPSKALQITPIDSGGPKLRRLHRLLQRQISAVEHVASLRDFRHALSRNRAYRYHLWGLGRPGSRKIEGLASFFTFRNGGFGGYIVLSGALKAKGLLRPLVARIEERMIKDNTGAKGWFIECDDTSMAPFVAAGFGRVPAMFSPPETRPPKRPAPVSKLHLLHKEFGSQAAGAPPPLPVVLACVRDILQHVYRVTRPLEHDCYRMVERTWQAKEGLPDSVSP